MHDAAPTSQHVPKHIVALSGSLRSGSSNTALLHAAALISPPHIRVTVYDGIATLPHFDPDLEPHLPPEVQRLRQLLCNCDAMIIASPEYAHGIPGAFKNALDWMVGCAQLGAKPVALLNGSSRAVHAHGALAEVLNTMGLAIIEPASMTIAVAGKGLDAVAIAADATLSAQLATVFAGLDFGPGQ